jgi:hypothetical protein
VSPVVDDDVELGKAEEKKKTKQFDDINYIKCLCVLCYKPLQSCVCV